MFKYPSGEIFREIGKIQQSKPIQTAAETTGAFIRNVGGYAAPPIGLGIGAGVGLWGVSKGISESAENLTEKKDKPDYTGAIKLILSAVFIFFLYKRLIK